MVIGPDMIDTVDKNQNHIGKSVIPIRERGRTRQFSI